MLNYMQKGYLSIENADIRAYEAPVCRVLFVETQGIICASNDPTELVGEIEGIW